MPPIPFATVPPTGYGPGSQPGADEEGLAYLPMPSGMRTYEPHVPEVGDVARVGPALATLAAVQEALAAWTPVGGAVLPLDGLDAANRAFLAETLGEGEVSILVEADGERIEVQEATFAGVWRVRAAAAKAGPARERIEVAAFPRGVAVRAFGREPAADPVVAAAPMPGAVNAPAMLTEILHRARTRRPGERPHVVNLTLLPHTPEDLAMLEARLGRGGVTILSRGYGNCRIDATATAGVWRIRYFNSSDTLILDTIEIVEVPEVACAAPEDIADSAGRLADVLVALA